MRLNQHWDWHPFFFWTNLPPFLIWALALLFKILPSTLTAIQILPLALSLLMVPMALFSIRRFYSPSTAFLYLAFVSTGFGFQYFGRICHQGLLLLLWEFLALWALGGYLHCASSGRRNLWALLCGLVIGSGFYTYFSWPTVGLMASLPILIRIWKTRWHPQKSIPDTLRFLAPMFLVLCPLFRRALSKAVRFLLWFSFRLR